MSANSDLVDFPSDPLKGYDLENINIFDQESAKDPFVLDNSSKEDEVQRAAIYFKVDSKRILRKTDIFLLLPLCLLYFISNLHKNIFGFILQSGLNGLDYTFTTFGFAYLAFFLPYAFLQFFSNFLLRYVRPHFWISTTVLLYGAISIGTAYCKTFGAYIGCNFVHGVCQAATETAIFYIISNYYVASEAQPRYSIIYGSSCFSGIILSFMFDGASKNLDGHHNLYVWQWMYIIIGAISMGSSIILFFVLPDFPEGARFFNDNEAMFLIKKLQIYNGKSGYTLKASFKTIITTIFDPMIFLPTLISFFMQVSVSWAMLIQPIINRFLFGFASSQTYIRDFLIFLPSFLFVPILGFIANYCKYKSPFVLVCNLVVGILLIYISKVNIWHMNESAYAATLIDYMFSHACMPILFCWASMNVHGHLRKSIIISMMIAAGTVGSTVNYWDFLNNSLNLNEMHLTSGFIVLYVFCFTGYALAFLYTYYIYYINRVKETSSYRMKWEQYTKEEQILLGDKNPYFKYQL